MSPDGSHWGFDRLSYRMSKYAPQPGAPTRQAPTIVVAKAPAKPNELVYSGKTPLSGQKLLLASMSRPARLLRLCRWSQRCMSGPPRRATSSPSRPPTSTPPPSRAR
jgi:hypothetical protein